MSVLEGGPGSLKRNSGSLGVALNEITHLLHAGGSVAGELCVCGASDQTHPACVHGGRDIWRRHDEVAHVVLPMVRHMSQVPVDIGKNSKENLWFHCPPREVLLGHTSGAPRQHPQLPAHVGADIGAVGAHAAPRMSSECEQPFLHGLMTPKNGITARWFHHPFCRQRLEHVLEGLWFRVHNVLGATLAQFENSFFPFLGNCRRRAVAQRLQDPCTNGPGLRAKLLLGAALVGVRRERLLLPLLLLAPVLRSPGDAGTLRRRKGTQLATAVLGF